MNPKKIIIIGGGPGGYVAAIRAAQLGARVTLIEKDRVGGTCLNRGCIPTKALLSDAKLFRSLRHSPVFQTILPNGFVPFEAMMERKKKVVQELVQGVETLLESYRITVRKARADLSEDREVILHEEGRKETLGGDAVILAPGSKSTPHPHIPPDGTRVITSDEALEMAKVPAELVIVGGGYIGVEFATLFNTLGSKVTIIEIMEDILPGLEGELVRLLRRNMEQEGIRIWTHSSVEEVEYRGEGLHLMVKTPKGVQETVSEKLLLSVGRGPNLDLDFSKAGVEVASSGIRVNRRMETSAPQVYAIGDANGGTLLAHVAMEEGGVAAENAVGTKTEMEDYPVPVCIFTYPEIASIGLTEKEARARGEIKIGRFPFRSNPTAQISGEPEGLIKVVTSRAEDTLLGVHVIGHDAGNLISIASCLMRQGITGREFSKQIQAHPTTPEALKEAFLDADGLAVHLPKPLRKKG